MSRKRTAEKEPSPLDVGSIDERACLDAIAEWAISNRIIAPSSDLSQFADKIMAMLTMPEGVDFESETVRGLHYPVQVQKLQAVLPLIRTSLQLAQFGNHAYSQAKRCSDVEGNNASAYLQAVGDFIRMVPTQVGQLSKALSSQELMRVVSESDLELLRCLASMSISALRKIIHGAQMVSFCKHHHSQTKHTPQSIMNQANRTIESIENSLVHMDRYVSMVKRGPLGGFLSILGVS